MGRPLDGAPLDAPWLPAPRLPLLTQLSHPREPLWTGRKAIDLFVPLARGFSHLVLGPPRSGRTGTILDALAHQAGTGVVGIFSALDGTTPALQRVRHVIGEAWRNTIVVHAPADAPAELRRLIAPTASILGEQIRAAGGHALVVYDRLDLHEPRVLSAAQLLDRAGHMRLSPRGEAPVRSGSLTVLATATLHAQGLGEWLPFADQRTVLRVDGTLDWKRSGGVIGQRPQLYAWEAKVAGWLQAFTEWEEHGRPEAPLFERGIQRGERLVALTRQPFGQRRLIEEQLAVVAALIAGKLDDVPAEALPDVEAEVIRRFRERRPELLHRLSLRVRREELLAGVREMWD